MREAHEWFSVDSKSFEISVDGEGRALKGFITGKKEGSGILDKIWRSRAQKSPKGD